MTKKMGRPKGPYTELIHIQVTPQMKARLRELSRRSGVAMVEFVRASLRTMLWMAEGREIGVGPLEVTDDDTKG